LNILLAHGSSDARHAEQVRALAANVSEKVGEAVGCAFLSDHRVPEGAHVLPLFLGEGGHGLVDAPQLAENSGAVLLPSLAHHADAIAKLACDCIAQSKAREHLLFGIYTFAAFEALNRALLAHGGRFGQMTVAALHDEPNVASVIRQWRAQGSGRIILQPLLLFDGRSMDEMAGQAKGDDIEILPPLAHSDRFAELIATLLRTP